MIKIHHPALDRTIEVDRMIAHIEGAEEGPTIIFFGGIHGNESSGVFALDQVMKELRENHVIVKGQIFALAGNLTALQKGKRYCTEDLNRIWSSDHMATLNNEKPISASVEKNEQRQIYQTLQQIVKENQGPFYFLDLHTTSSESVPFVVVNDSLLNRRFAEQFPVPMILGIEEYLDGPILSHINELGYVSFGFEAGQHDDLASYQNHMAFIYLCLAFSECVDKKQIQYYHYYEQLAKTSITIHNIYEISYRFALSESDHFEMNPGFVNFQRVKKGQKMAIRNGNQVIASRSGRIFMPLYQNQGTEGFFEIRSIHPFFLRLSAALRKTKFAHILPFLPGIRWQSAKHDAMVVNLKIARILAKPFLHLLGYRSKQIDKNYLVIKNREAASRVEEYEAEWNS